jgi:hypothetical protein
MMGDDVSRMADVEPELEQPSEIDADRLDGDDDYVVKDHTLSSAAVLSSRSGSPRQSPLVRAKRATSNDWLQSRLPGVSAPGTPGVFSSASSGRAAMPVVAYAETTSTMNTLAVTPGPMRTPLSTEKPAPPTDKKNYAVLYCAMQPLCTKNSKDIRDVRISFVSILNAFIPAMLHVHNLLIVFVVVCELFLCCVGSSYRLHFTLTCLRMRCVCLVCVWIHKLMF